MKAIGLLNGVPSYNPGVYSAANPGSFDTGEAQMGGTIVLHNISPYDLLVWFDEHIEAQFTLHTWQPRKWDFAGKQRRVIYFYPAYIPPQNFVTNAPASYLWGESYQRGEPVPEFYPADARISNVGNSQLPSTAASAIDNENNPVGTSLVKAVPSGYSEPTMLLANDGSGSWLLTSQGILRAFLTLINGFGATEGQVILGDQADPAMTVLHGTADSATQAAQATTATSASQASALLVYDGALNNQHTISTYEGVTDPATYLTPNEGDIWYQG